MINGLGIVGWGVGGIEAEAGMLGQPVYFLTPDVVGVHLTGQLREGVTATDLVLHVTEMLRKAKVVGKFVEFFGEGAASLAAARPRDHRQHGARVRRDDGLLPGRRRDRRYLAGTGPHRRSRSTRSAVYFKAQGLFGIPQKGEVDYSAGARARPRTVAPSVAGPKRPQDRIELDDLKAKFVNCSRSRSARTATASRRRSSSSATSPTLGDSGGGRRSRAAASRTGSAERSAQHQRNDVEMMNNRPTPDRVDARRRVATDDVESGHGDVLIAAITSCTNTSNPSVMLAAGLLAKKAVERGLKVQPRVKTSLAPGSRVVTEYLRKAGLQPYLDQLGFHVVGYGCTTCIGNSGPLDPRIEDAIIENDLIGCAVLSRQPQLRGARAPDIKANFLCRRRSSSRSRSPGTSYRHRRPSRSARASDGEDVFLQRHLADARGDPRRACKSRSTRRPTGGSTATSPTQNPLWNEIPSATGAGVRLDRSRPTSRSRRSSSDFGMQPGGSRATFSGARPLGIFGDSVTTDHISPAGAIKATSPAGQYLIEHGVVGGRLQQLRLAARQRRVMMRGTFANVRIKNLMVPRRRRRRDGAHSSRAASRWPSTTRR